MLASKLKEKGYEVIEATNGKEGLLKAKDKNPDLILLDIRMPVMDGMTMLRQLRKTDSNKKTKVIMLTNIEPDDKMIGKIIKDQPSCYLVKSDIQFKELMEKISEVLKS